MGSSSSSSSPNIMLGQKKKKKKGWGSGKRNKKVRMMSLAALCLHHTRIIQYHSWILLSSSIETKHTCSPNHTLRSPPLPWRETQEEQSICSTKGGTAKLPSELARRKGSLRGDHAVMAERYAIRMTLYRITQTSKSILGFV